MDPEELLLDAASFMSEHNFSDAMGCLIDYADWRKDGGIQPKVSAWSVPGDNVFLILSDIVLSRNKEDASQRRALRKAVLSLQKHTDSH